MRLASAALALCAAAAQAQPLSDAELSDLARFDGRGFDEARAEARVAFAGKGARVAEHYLRNTGVRPGGYFVVLQAVADVETAHALIRGLVDPPAPDSGPEFESGGRRQRLPRYEGEIAALLDPVLAADGVSADAGVARALAEAVVTLLAKPHSAGLGAAQRAVELLGKLRSEVARDALRRFAMDPRMRDSALGALGTAGGSADASLLVAALSNDPQARTRVEAARALGRLRAAEALPALKRALVEEREPTVIDAVIEALAQFNALPQEPGQCFDAAARAMDARPAGLALACWRMQASRETLLNAALEAPTTVRALALMALFERPQQGERPIVRSRSAPVPPPPVQTQTRAMPSAGMVPTPAAPAPAPATRFDDATRLRLLDSAVGVLSSRLSHTLAYPMNELLIDIAGGDMALAQRHADAIVTRHARSTNDGRLAASHALWRRDAAAYEAARRPQQAALAGGLAVLVLILTTMRTLRFAAIAAATPLAAWAVASLFIGGVRELPPLALAPLTITGSASLAAGLAAAAVVLARERGIAGGWPSALLIGAGGLTAGAVAAFFLCGAVRWYGVFPIGGEGWELIFDPLGAGLVGVPLTALGLAAAAVARRLAP